MNRKTEFIIDDDRPWAEVASDSFIIRSSRGKNSNRHDDRQLPTGNPKGIVSTVTTMNEPRSSPTTSRQLPPSIPILTAITTTASAAFSIAFWVAALFLVSPMRTIYNQLGAELPVATQWMFVRGGWGLMWLGVIWSGIFCYGAYRRWLSQRLARILLVGTLVLMLVYGAIAFLAICLPFYAVMEQIS